MRTFTDLTGQRFDRLQVISITVPNRHGQNRYLCKCDCGNEKIVVGTSLNQGRTRSCGCLKQDLLRSHCGPKSYQWNGGRTVTSAGYVRIRQHGHPRTDPRGYVPEHIVKMETKLGRYLYPGETVHHRNGIKDDNRIENLELMVSHHPSGQKPEDLVNWAKQILSIYEPTALKAF